MGKSGKAARTRGHEFELQICKLLNKRGFYAVTSRSESKRLDDLGSDIVTDFPYHLKCKFVEALSRPNHKLLAEMKKALTDKPPAVIHKRANKGIIVSLLLDDFLELIKNE